MKIMIVDGQGGGVGRSLVERMRAAIDGSGAKEIELIAVGTNATATANMMRGGTSNGATGENAVIYNSRRADVLVGPIGIIMANAMLGEITPAMAEAVADAEGALFLIPMNRCKATVIGLEEKKLAEYIEEAVERIMAYAESGKR